MSERLCRACGGMYVDYLPHSCPKGGGPGPLPDVYGTSDAEVDLGRQQGRNKVTRRLLDAIEEQQLLTAIAVIPSRGPRWSSDILTMRQAYRLGSPWEHVLPCAAPVLCGAPVMAGVAWDWSGGDGFWCGSDLVQHYWVFMPGEPWVRA